MDHCIVYSWARLYRNINRCTFREAPTYWSVGRNHWDIRFPFAKKNPKTLRSTNYVFIYGSDSDIRWSFEESFLQVHGSRELLRCAGRCIDPSWFRLRSTELRCLSHRFNHILPRAQWIFYRENYEHRNAIHSIDVCCVFDIILIHHKIRLVPITDESACRCLYWIDNYHDHCTDAKKSVKNTH